MIGFDLYILLLREPCELHPCYWLDNHRGCGCHHPRFGLGGAQVEWRYARLNNRDAGSSDCPSLFHDVYPFGDTSRRRFGGIFPATITGRGLK